MSIQIHPEIERLRKDYEVMRQQLAYGIAERDRLLTIVKSSAHWYSTA